MMISEIFKTINRWARQAGEIETRILKVLAKTEKLDLNHTISLLLCCLGWEVGREILIEVFSEQEGVLGYLRPNQSMFSIQSTTVSQCPAKVFSGKQNS